MDWEISSNEKKLPEYLNDAGYDTHLFGVQHESSDAQTLGYSEVHDCPKKASPSTESVIAWLKQQTVAEREKPFFISLGFEEPHRPYPHDDSEYAVDHPGIVTPLPYLPDTPGILKDIAGLNGLVKRVDDAVGQLLSALEETGFSRNTLVIFTTDHGIAMPRAKGTCYDPGINVALLMRLPGHIESGTVCTDLLSNVDYLPTLIEIAGGNPPDQIEGKSFLSLLTGDDYEKRTHIFCEMSWHDRYNPMRAVRTERFKYIRNFGDRSLVYIPADIFVGSAGEAVRDIFYAQRRPAEEIYDLKHDPLEFENLAGRAEVSDEQNRLRNLVDEWMQETNDPLLRGPVPPTPKQQHREDTDDLPNR